MDDSTNSLPLAIQLEAFVLFRHRSDEHRRRYKEDGLAITHNDAVEGYKLLARLWESYVLDCDSVDLEICTLLEMVCAPRGDAFIFREPAVRTIIEGFEREITEDSDALYLLHDGEAVAREV